MMKAVVLFALIGLAFSAPQPRKLFHEHWDDFMDIVFSEAGDDIEQLMEQYIKFDEFVATLNYLRTNSFKDLVYEMEDLPEFRAVVDFLEKDNIDMHFFLDQFNEMINRVDKKNARQSLSGRDFSSFITDSIAVFPKDKLSALFDQKMSEDEEFGTAIENLGSEEWDQTFGALWENETFQAKVQTLLEHGIDVHLLLHEIKAVFGQF